MVAVFCAFVSFGGGLATGLPVACAGPDSSTLVLFVDRLEELGGLLGEGGIGAAAAGGSWLYSSSSRGVEIRRRLLGD